MVFLTLELKISTLGAGAPLRSYFELGKISVTRQANHTLQYGRKVVIYCIRGTQGLPRFGRPDRPKTLTP
jgi:hypothetical protein